DATSEIAGRDTQLRVSSSDAAFALLDQTTSQSVQFGGVPAMFAEFSRTNTTPTETPTSGCSGSFFTGRKCVGYQALKPATMVLASAVDPQWLLHEWVRQNRPVWLFAVIVVLGGAAASVFNAITLRARQRDRAQLASA